MSIENKLKNFIKNNPINTNGAITTPKVTIKYYDDGDTGYYIKVPYCSWNYTWQASAFEFIKKFQEEFEICSIVLNVKYFKIDYNLTMCNPD